MKPLVFAHRGASGQYPENTMEAFRAALKQGADGIELDVQLTRDKEVVVIHDSNLERTTTGSGMVYDCTLEELRSLSAGSWLHSRFASARVPTLWEVFAFAASTRLRLILEMKNFFIPQPELEEKLVELIEHFGLQKRVVLSSFNYNSLAHIKRIAPHLQTGLLYLGHLHHPWEVALEYGTNQIHVPLEEISAQLVQQAHHHGLVVYCWTVNASKTMRRLAEMRVDGIMTNFPLRARKLFAHKRT